MENLVAQEAIQDKKVLINKKEYNIKQEYITDEECMLIKDKKIIYEILKADQTQEEIKNLLKIYSIEQLNLVNLYAIGQEITIKDSEYFEWVLTLPSKLLGEYFTDEKISSEEVLNEFKKITKKKLEETLEDVAKNPKSHLRLLAYQYFSESRKKFEENIDIIKKFKEEARLNYEDCTRFEENSAYISTYIEPSQRLYHKVVNKVPLEDIWTMGFIDIIKGLLPEKLEKITDNLLKKVLEETKKKLENYDPLQTFKKAVKENEEKQKNKLKETKDSLEEKVNQFSNYKPNNQIVFTSNRDGNYDIYSMSKEGENIFKLTNNKDGDLYPQWTKDRKIIYTSKQGGSWGIWVMDEDGANKKLLTFNKTNEYCGCMTSDNKWLIFVSNKKGDYDIYRKDMADRRNVEQVTNNKEREDNLEVSPDGKWIAYEKWKDSTLLGVYITSIDGAATKEIGWGHDPTWTPQGNISFSERGKIIVKDIEGNEKFVLGKELENIKEKPLIIYPYCWIDENRLLYRLDSYVEGEKGSYMNFYIYDRKTKEIKALTKSKINIWNDHADYLE